MLDATTSSNMSAGSKLEFHVIRDRYLSAQLSGNRREALRLVIEDGLQRGASVSELQLQVVQEAQRELGRLWEEDRISIAQEHMATAIAQVTLVHLYQHAPVPTPHGKKVMVACVEGELHDFPARLVSDALELAGFDVRYLGANVPTSSLLSFIAQESPDLLALSVTMVFNAPALRAAMKQVRERHPKLPVVVGGNACKWAPGLVQEVGAAGTANDAGELLALTRRLLKERR